MRSSIHPTVTLSTACIRPEQITGDEKKSNTPDILRPRRICKVLPVWNDPLFPIWFIFHPLKLFNVGDDSSDHNIVIHEVLERARVSDCFRRIPWYCMVMRL